MQCGFVIYDPYGFKEITEAVPKYESGQEVSDCNTAFEAGIKTVSNGKITITLKETLYLWRRNEKGNRRGSECHITILR